MTVGVGNYDVNTEYLTEAEAYHTLAEKVQRIREREIQTWIQGMCLSPQRLQAFSYWL